MEIDLNKISSMMRQYLDTKEQYKDCILLYRLGDFYEMFFDDAIIASKELELTLTGRDCGLKERAPMCGVPYHAVDTYISRLISKGYKVAICEQLTSPKDQKGLVERDVVRVISAGTIVEDSILDDKKNNYIASIFVDGDGVGISWADLSTGELNMIEYVGDNSIKNAESMLNSIHASEIICNSGAKDVFSPDALYKVKPQLYFDWAYRFAEANEILLKQFKVATLESFEVHDKKYGIPACGALIQYFNETQKRFLSQFTKVSYVKNNDIMLIDANTRRNLELTETLRDRRKVGTLLWLLDRTQSSMGARKIRKWVDSPLQNPTHINQRLTTVKELVENHKLRNELINAFAPMRDLERLATKVAFGTVNPREMYSIAQCLLLLPVFKSILSKAKSGLLHEVDKRIHVFNAITKKISKAIVENAPVVISEGGFIAPGYDGEVDTLRHIKEDASDWIRQYEASERERTGIKTLRISNNKIFGYYIEVTKSFVNLVPDTYIRKQTTVNSERYKTQELADIENKIFNSHDLAVQREIDIFNSIKAELLEIVSTMLTTANSLAVLDCLLSFAIVSYENNYVYPIINSKIKSYNIVGARHPVVEKLIDKNKFIANDCTLDEECRTMIITGPNMAGKSTYMRQIALIVLMAHVGCFVPCTKAEICVTDRIFTRVGASDDLSNAQSTFMVEMIEVANILNYATSKSLLILDEIGRGTSTCDGLSIAWAVLEYVNKVIKCKTLFATHYHELTDLETKMEGIKNYRILVNELQDTVIFLHKIARGGTNKSFGIEVAGLAGVPKAVTDRAKQISKELEKRTLKDNETIIEGSLGEVSHQQMDMFSNQLGEEVLAILKETDVNSLTPMQALIALSDLVERAKNG